MISKRLAPSMAVERQWGVGQHAEHAPRAAEDSGAWQGGLSRLVHGQVARVPERRHPRRVGVAVCAQGYILAKTGCKFTRESAESK